MPRRKNDRKDREEIFNNAVIDVLLLDADGAQKTCMGIARRRNDSHALQGDLCCILTGVVDPVAVVPVASLVLASIDFNNA